MDSDDVTFEYETVWLDANRYYEVEGTYYELLVAESKKRTNPNSSSKQSAKRNKRTPVGRIVIKGISQSSLASEIAYARQKIQNFLKASDLGVEAPLKQGETMMSRLEELEQGYESIIKRLDKLTGEVQGALEDKDARMKAKRETKENEAPKKEEKKDAVQNGSSVAAEDDNDIDLFGSDEELDAAAVKLKEERLEAYKNKKAEKPAIIAKSGVLLDVKPWDDETDMVAMEKAVRNIICDGLFWGGGKLVPLAYGIKKLQIVAIVEDEKCSVDWLTETICGIEDLVQSVDIASFYKL